MLCARCVVRPWPALRASACATIKGQLRERPHARANQKLVSCMVAGAPRTISGPCAFLTANQRRALPRPKGPKTSLFTPPTVVACACDGGTRPRGRARGGRAVAAHCPRHRRGFRAAGARVVGRRGATSRDTRGGRGSIVQSSLILVPTRVSRGKRRTPIVLKLRQSKERVSRSPKKQKRSRGSTGIRTQAVRIRTASRRL